MYTCKITLFALTATLSFEMENETKEVVDEFFEELIKVFIDHENNVVNDLHENSSEIQQRIEIFTNKYNNLYPQLNSLPSYFRRLKEREHFFFIPNEEIDQREDLRYSNMLKAISTGKPFEEINRQSLELFSGLLDNYLFIEYGRGRFFIGEPEKSKRLCRFCNNNRPITTFNNKAHAISEALGNKTLILFDECDSCNLEFSKNIEPDIVQFLSLLRTIYDVKGKNGRKEIDGKNFTITNDGKIRITLKRDGEITKPVNFPLALKLETNNVIILQNIYKALCKFFLSVIENKYLAYFNKTIDWINGKIQIEQLPRVVGRVSNRSSDVQPKIFTFIRQNDEKTLPFAIGEFRFTCMRFVFIIPFAEKDDRDFTNEIDFKIFWQTLHFKNDKVWNFFDFSSCTPFPLSFSVNLEEEK